MMGIQWRTDGGSCGQRCTMTKLGVAGWFHICLQVINKRLLSTLESIQDVRNEVEVLHHLAGHPNVVNLEQVLKGFQGSVTAVQTTGQQRAACLPASAFAAWNNVVQLP